MLPVLLNKAGVDASAADPLGADLHAGAAHAAERQAWEVRSGAATLLRIEPQVFGNQYSSLADQPAMQEPYDRAAASDRSRQLFGTGTLAGQEQRRRGYDEGRTTP